MAMATVVARQTYAQACGARFSPTAANSSLALLVIESTSQNHRSSTFSSADR